jgi:hypothetical protein
MKKLYKSIFILLVSIMVMHAANLSAQSNQYLHFDKVDDFVQLVDGSQYFSGSSQLSLTGWFYCDALAYGQGYMGFRAGSGNAEFYLIQLNNGVMECRLVTTAGFHEFVAPANTAIPQVWQHIAWIYDGSAIKLYVNGTLIGSSPASGVFSGTNVTFGIGKSILGGFNFVYGGRIDEISAWNKALTQTEIEDIIDNELTGTEEGLQLYYKFNQGVPGGDNTSITKLECEIGSGERDADLMNFALTGETSNFNGTLNPGYQAISFPQIPNHLVSDAPFMIEATATSGLDVLFQVISGPASIDGNIVTLNGTAGEVVIEATQPGNSQWDPAETVTNTFMVLDPATHVPEIDPRHPLEGNVYIPSLSSIQLAAISTITYPDLFHVDWVHFTISGTTISAQNFLNDHFTAWWTPPSYGNFTITITSANNYGAVATQTVSINVTQTVSDMEIIAAQDIWLNPNNVTQTVEAELPSFLGAFNQVQGLLEVSCPSGGCGEWDRVASVDAKGHDGRWFEIIRYITPYGVSCSHSIDLTDYISILNGKISFRFNCATLDNGYLYKLTLFYTAGTPEYLYSTINEIWNEIYPFGDYANLQPVEIANYQFPDNAAAATLKLVSTGHGWGDLNTGNAAEFYDATHHIWINGAQTFEQHNWYDCNPNPDACQPQNGTWYYNRAGWCPGSIAQWFDYNMTPFISSQDIELQYVFYENYVDLCHPNNPDCVTGVTCSDCNDGFNPTLDVACNLVVFAENPIVVGQKETPESQISLTPNPTNGRVEISMTGNGDKQPATVVIYDMTGMEIGKFYWDGNTRFLDLASFPKGMYMISVENKNISEVKKLLIY